MNAVGGTSRSRVSPDTRLLVRRALEGHRFTGGRFDPTVLHAVIAAGYDRTLRRRSPVARCQRPRGSRRWGPRASRSTTTRAPSGFRSASAFDPGGIGKGSPPTWSRPSSSSSAPSARCVNVGGDLRVIGDGARRRRVARSRSKIPAAGRRSAPSSRQPTAPWPRARELRRRWTSAGRRRAPPPHRAAHRHERVDGGARRHRRRVGRLAGRGPGQGRVPRRPEPVGVDGAATGSSRLGVGALVVHEHGVITNERWRRFAARRVRPNRRPRDGQPAVVVQRASRRHRRLGAAHRVGALGPRALDEAPPAARAPGVDARPPPVPRRARHDLRRRPRRVDHPRLVHALRVSAMSSCRSHRRGIRSPSRWGIVAMYLLARRRGHLAGPALAAAAGVAPGAHARLPALGHGDGPLHRRRAPTPAPPLRSARGDRRIGAVCALFGRPDRRARRGRRGLPHSSA